MIADRPDWWPNAKVDIEIYLHVGPKTFAQARYLAHGTEDCFWTDDIDEALRFLKEDAENYGR